MACFVKAISLLNLLGPWTPPSSFYGQIFTPIPGAPWLLFAGAKQSSFVSGWYNFPFLLSLGLPSAQCWPLNVHGFFTGNAPPNSHAFAYLNSPDLQLKVFSYPLFLRKLRAILQSLNLPAKDYACHSFRRGGGGGGASFAFQAGVPIELIKMLGDWLSDAVLLYLTVPLTIRLQSVNVIAKAIINNNSSTLPPPQFGFGV